MNILSVQNLTKSYGTKKLFDNINFGIEEGEKIGLLGINGTGKTTFLKVLAGVDSPDVGEVITGNNLKIAYLPQNPWFDHNSTVLEQVFADSKQGFSEEEFWSGESDAKTILTKLGIEDFTAKISTLSGGQRKRVALARALINPADLLILDEPTNHIDNETIAWLEQYLSRRRVALLMVTHDRYFLDRVTNRIIELDNGNLYSYTGNYSTYLEARALREEQAAASERKRLNLYRNELAWIKRGAKARTTKQKARIDRFEKLKESKVDLNDGKLEIEVGASRLGKKVLEFKKVSMGFGGEPFIRDFSYIFSREERLGIIGPNGAGKSTLLNLITGRLTPDKGEIETGPTVKIGYFSQENTELDRELRVIEYIREGGEFIPTSQGNPISASQMLERFMFPSGMQWTPLGKLSGGEKRRVYLLRVLMEAPNVLLLDEPTNDLDVQTLAILEDYLDDFPGAVVVVSHDRYFLDRVAEKIFVFEEGGQINEFLGNYSEYREFIKSNLPGADPLRGAEAAPARDTAGREPEKPKTRQLKFSFKEQKEFEEIDDIIAGLEEQLKAADAKIEGAGTNYVLLQELLDTRKGLEAQLDEKLERWTYLNELAEEIERNKS